MPPKPKLKHRDVAEFLSRLRNFFLGRTHKTALRFADTVSPRTQPPPAVPQGPSENLIANYYYARDPRRLVKPAVDLVQEHKQALAKEATKEAAKDAQAKTGEISKEGAAPPESEDADAEHCDQREDSGVKKLPTPGKVHSWEGPR
ncbi:NADH dehydrogenase [ubiquinone] 1 alpha subcomplex subunit 7 [Drosophila elegans]|uniref:NADH dehydrogenase [ubiquinone] 1 alpha subcomplex subunit 7 n=1 Tax=Drosophila elegans TaxID=30023 RepID=UPI0007E655AB|nr:NADH dehydrogenase [ubiquinone] 1 alpha subcomplex subunit 7 [Drosophila elegans]